MLVQDQERCLSAIQKTLQFYNKAWDQNTRQFWTMWLRQQRNPELVLDALRIYPNEGRYAPRPADIQQLIEKLRPPKTTFKEQAIIDDCPSEIKMAWNYWLPKFWGDMPIKLDAVDAEYEQAEQWLLLINEEAKRCNLPDAIPDTHKLQEIWQ